MRRGQYHTLDLGLNQKFYLMKQVWDKLAQSQLNNARDISRNAEIAVVIMQEGLAFVCLLTTNMTVQKAKIEMNIPRKRKNFCSQHQKGMDNFYEQILQAMLRHINFEVTKCVLIASPGFVKDQFIEYMWQQANKHDIKSLLDNREKFLPAHSSTGFKHSIREILSDPLIQPKLEDTKAVQEVKIWNKFQDLLSMEPNKAVYGLRDVETANHYEAIGYLMVSDMLFRSNDLSLRKKYTHLMDSARKYGADVRVFSSMHICGQQLNQLTGVAAILKFEVPDLSDRMNASNKADVDGDSSTSSSSSSSGSTISTDDSNDEETNENCGQSGETKAAIFDHNSDEDDDSESGAI